MKTNTSIMRKLSIAVAAVILFITACKKTEDLGEAPRLFRPTLAGQLSADSNTIVAAWQKINGAKSYSLQLSRDSFRTIDRTLQLDTNVAVLKQLLFNQTYQLQVRAIAPDSLKNSGWSNLGSVKTLSSILKTPGLTDITDVAVRVSWTTKGAPVTSIKILKTADSSVVKNVSLTSADVTNQFKIINGLTPDTRYTIFLYSGTDVRGWVDFSTKPTLSGSVIDLRSITGRPTVLYDTLSQIPSGSTVLLSRDEVYTIPSAFTFTKAVTIMTGAGFSGAPAKLLMANNFDASGNIDSLRFENITIAKNGANYFMNVGGVAKIGKVSFEGITTEGVFDNSFIRLKTAGDEISKLTINNSIIDSFGVAAKYPILYANASSSAKIDNIEITNSTFFCFYYFVRQDGVTTTSLAIDNVTFDSFIDQAGYFVNYSTVFPSTFTIKNTIFGKTKDKLSSNWIKSTGTQVLTNTYSTSDCIFSANPITGTIPYPKTAAELFTDPSNGNFKILDNTFAGKNTAGDPRWR